MSNPTPPSSAVSMPDLHATPGAAARYPTPPRTAWLVLRILVGLPFIASGVFNAINWTDSNDFNAILMGEAAAPVLTVLGIMQIAGGVALIAGRVQLGAIILLAFLVPATLRHVLAAGVLVGDDPLVVVAKRGQLSCVEKNTGLIGVLLFFLIAYRRVPKSTLGTS